MAFRFVLISLLLCTTAAAQPTLEMIGRTLMIESRFYRGTAFSIDIDGREYWITARHILTGAKKKPYGKVVEKTRELKVLNPGGKGEVWMRVKFTILQPSSDIDVVVLVPQKPLVPGATKSPPANSDGLMFGGNCEFLGFPHGGAWKAKFADGNTYWLPFTKHCSVSAMNQEARLWILDGINNVGFSGGPVITGTGDNLKIVAVVSGYITEPAEVIRGSSNLGEPPTKDTVNLNAGFILAYDIEHAVDLIKKNPIGPLRQTK